ncbi:MAG: hypothetical protein ACRDRN_17985 [Sciscionella sp.]
MSELAPVSPDRTASGPLIKRSSPQREWLLRCEEGDDVAVCGIGVSEGIIEIIGPDDHTAFELSGSDIAAYRDALAAAIDVAEADLRRTGQQRRPAPCR